MVERTHVGPFRLVSRLGNHRRHRVFHAVQEEQQRDVAIKFIRLPPEVDRGRALARIQREVEILKGLEHPNLARVFGAGVEEDEIFFACELIRGESLTSLLARRGRLSPDLVVEIARQVAAALAYLHEREIVHGKLTPDKVILDADNHVHLIDVRLNRARRRTWDGGDRRELDAAAYMAPEQFNEGASEKSDLYALGAMIFEMLTGRIPHEPENIARIYQQKLAQRPPSVCSMALDCPIWIDRLVTSMLDPSPAGRPHTALAVFYALQEIRKIDQNQTPVVRQMAAGFNPLTAGADKSEARRLLGELAPVEVERMPWLQRTSVQAVGLLVIVAAIVFFSWPVSDATLYRRGLAAARSGEVAALRKAAESFERIVQRGRRDPLAKQAADRLLETQTRILWIRAKEGYTGVEPLTRRFADAYLAEQAGRAELALVQYRRLVEQIDPAGPQRHIRIESDKRIEELTKVDPPAEAAPAETESAAPSAEPPTAGHGESPKAPQ